jgi:hypothetical protein
MSGLVKAKVLMKPRDERNKPGGSAVVELVGQAGRNAGERFNMGDPSIVQLSLSRFISSDDEQGT